MYIAGQEDNHQFKESSFGLSDLVSHDDVHFGRHLRMTSLA